MDLKRDPIACPLCGTPSPFSLSYATRDFFHCPHCDLIFVPSTQHVELAAERQRYEQHNNNENNAGYVDMLDTVVNLLRRFAGDAKRVLDYGCGPTPVLVNLLQRAGLDATGYDPIFAPGANLSKSFDAIVCVETVEHFRQPRESWTHMISLLRPGGILLVQTHFHTGPDSIDGWWYAHDKTHVSFYSDLTIDRICARFQLTLRQRDATHAVMSLSS